jgi:Zn-dependent peptidase ImmA (M78 family)
MAITKALQRAEQVLAENYVLEPPVHVHEIAKNYGVEIEETAFPEDMAHIQGFIVPKGDDRAVMYINANDSANRRTFTVAHELGHWLLHRDKILSDPDQAILYRVALGQLNEDPMEQEANAFAAELLVPMKFLKMQAKSLSQEELARKFGVSAAVIGYRKVALKHAESANQAN